MFLNKFEKMEMHQMNDEIDFNVDFQFNEPYEEEKNKVNLSKQTDTETTIDIEEINQNLDLQNCEPYLKKCQSEVNDFSSKELLKCLYREGKMRFFIQNLKTLKGSVLCQVALESNSEIDIDFLLNKIEPYLVELMCSKYANYFIQKFFRKLNFEQRIKVFKIIENNFEQICFDASGTHSIQGLIQVIKTPLEQRILESLLSKNLLNFILNENANHIIQKILIEHSDTQKNFIVYFILENFEELRRKYFGFICIQKLISITNNSEVKLHLSKIVISNSKELISSEYGSLLIILAMEKFGLQYFSSIINEFLERDSLIFYSTLNKSSAFFIENFFKLINKINRSFFLSFLYSLFSPQGGFVQTLLSLEIGRNLLFQILMTSSPQIIEYFIINYYSSPIGNKFCIELRSYFFNQ